MANDSLFPFVIFVAAACWAVTTIATAYFDAKRQERAAEQAAEVMLALVDMQRTTAESLAEIAALCVRPQPSDIHRAAGGDAPWTRPTPDL